jgi:hypothetical protein
LSWHKNWVVVSGNLGESRDIVVDGGGGGCEGVGGNI